MLSIIYYNKILNVRLSERGETFMKYVLVVEDDPITLKILCTTIEKHGFSSIKVTNGSDALLHLKNHNIHAVILDLNLPDMNGIEILKHIRIHPVLNSIAIIIVTENDDKLEAILGLEWSVLIKLDMQLR
jgi:DNA-binding response OmpR family regulator